MGDIKRISCECGYKTDLYTGAGRGAIDLRIVENLFPAEASIIHQKIDSGDKILFSLDNTIALCSKCRKLKTISRLSYSTDTEGESLVYNKKCSDCNSEITIIPEEKTICPNCGNKPDIQKIGHWD